MLKRSRVERYLAPFGLYFMQAAGAAVILKFHHCVGRTIAADAAGIEKDQFGGFVEIGDMGVAEKNGIDAPLHACIAGDLIAFFHPQGMAVADEKRNIFERKHFFGGFRRTEITVAGNLLERNMRKKPGKGFSVFQMIP